MTSHINRELRNRYGSACAVWWEPRHRYGGELSFDFIAAWNGGPERCDPVERMHLLGVAGRWNQLPKRGRWLMWGASWGSYVWLFLDRQEDPLLVAAAVMRAWFDGDTRQVEAITEQRIARLPPVQDYRRGHDMHVRLPGGGTWRVWSKPKRGPLHVYPDPWGREGFTLPGTVELMERVTA